MTTYSLTVTSTTSGIVVLCPNPFPNEYMSGITYSLYAGTKASTIPPASTPSAPTLQNTTIDYLNAGFLFSTGTAGKTYVFSCVIKDPSGKVITTAVSAPIVMPKVVTAASTAPKSLTATVGNDGNIYIGSNAAGLIYTGGSGFYSKGGTAASFATLQRGTQYSTTGSGYPVIGVITTLPFKDPSAKVGVNYFYNIWYQDVAGGYSTGVTTASSPVKIPATTGAVVPATPTMVLYSDDRSFWVWLQCNDTGGAALLSYNIYADTVGGTTLVATVDAKKGPWYQIKALADGSAPVNGTVYYVCASANNVIGTSEPTPSGLQVTPAAKTPLNLSTLNVMNPSATKEYTIAFNLSGGKPPYTTTLYYGYGNKFALSSAFKVVSGIYSGYPVITASNPNVYIYVATTDSAGKTVNLGYTQIAALGAYAPGDMSDYIDTWMSRNDSVTISESSVLRQVYMSGVPLATSDGPTAKATMHLAMLEGRVPLFDAKSKLSYQGQTSLAAAYKGLKAKLSNKDTGNALKLKVGSSAPSSTWDLKSYGYTDDTMVRDIVAAKLWKKIRTGYATYPEKLGFPESALGAVGSLTQYYGETSLCTEGFPVELYTNGEYQGLYVWRQTVNPSMYQMDDTNPNHILMKYDHSGGTKNGQLVDLMNWQKALSPADWDMKSPHISAYTDQASLAKQAPAQYAAFNTWWSTISAYVTKPTTTTWTAASKVLDMNAMIDYYLFSEATFNTDGVSDNFLLLSWDGKTFVPYAYDLDQTFGNNNNTVQPSPTTELMANDPFWNIVPTNWNTQLKARYQYLRDNNILSIVTLEEDVRKFIAMIGRDARMRAHNAWGINGVASEGSLSYMLDWYKSRLAWMDTTYGYTPSKGSSTTTVTQPATVLWF